MSGKPISWKRPGKGRSGKRFDSQLQEKGRVKTELKKQHPRIINKPVRLKIVAYFERPKDHYINRKKTNQLKESAPKHHTHYPDYDNIAKFYTDCLSKISFPDDKNVVYGSCEKVWVKDNPGILIEIEYL